MIITTLTAIISGIIIISLQIDYVTMFLVMVNIPIGVILMEMVTITEVAMTIDEQVIGSKNQQKIYKWLSS